MLSKNQGYGISGARNVFANSTTRIGNWVEDGYGSQLAHATRVGGRSFETEYSRQHKPIEERPPIPEGNFKVPSVQDLKVKNKDGLPYIMIFKHGLSDVTAEDRFTTMSKSNSRRNLDNFASTDGSLQKHKAKLAQQDVLAGTNKTTEARYANGYINALKPNSIPHAAIGRSENLPVWGRRSLIDK